MIAGNSQATFDYAAGPGTVEYALSRPDGARVSLTMVVIGRVDSDGITVHEWWDKTTPIPILFKPSGLKTGQTIDLEGRMTSLASGRRAIICDRIALYLDRFGHLVDAVPPLKGLLDPNVWPSRGWTPVTQASGMSMLTMTPLEDPEPPGEGGPSVVGVDPDEGTIAWAKSLEDDDEVQLVDKIVTAGTDLFEGYIYIEETDRSSGIRVKPVYGPPPATGNTVTVSGTMNTTADGERFIDDATVEGGGWTEPQTVGLINRDVGGPDFTDGTTVFQAGVWQGYGLNNIGLLVKTWGKITYVDANGDFIYIDDGSGAEDGFLDGNDDPVVGIRVSADPDDLATGNSITLPGCLDARVEVVGISSCKMVGSNRARMIRVRSQADITPSVVYAMTAANGGDDDDDGLSWATAKESVTDALDVAQAGTDVWVAAGEYDENITLKDGVGLYGGFSPTGGESSRDERDWQTNVTILDGGGSGTVVTCPSGLTSKAVIDGFTIRDGTSSGIYCSCSSPAISNNVITGNSAYSGGGIYCEGDPAPTITNNTITDNSAHDGGGIYCNSSSPDVVDNSITENSASVYGAGICCSYASPQILRNSIESNTVSHERGGMFGEYSSALVSANKFIDNDGGDHGGGIALHYSEGTLVVNNLFKGNHVAGRGGAGITTYDSSPQIINNTFASNEATAANGFPGYGGAILVRQPENTPLIVNNIFYNNAAVAGRSVACVEGATATILFCDAFSDVSNAYSYHYSGCPELGQDCIYVDPLFVSPAAGDYHLQIPTGSTPTPIDKGHNRVDNSQSDYYHVPLTDMDNSTRPANISTVTDYAADAYTDMGAYEAQE